MDGYWLAHYFPKMISDSKDMMPTFKNIGSALKKAKMQLKNSTPYSVRPDLQDLFLYAGKHKPSLYLDKQFRDGISSFASLANKEEVAQGLAALKADIDSGEIYQIVKTYQNSLGDYLYLDVSN
ncbi:hypothetical protein [Muriicola sp.]|uniref:hypothetical protein n=1 Tax=Muriicola sp. TaxID=2020856 RepID=UPI003C75C3AC